MAAATDAGIMMQYSIFKLFFYGLIFASGRPKAMTWCAFCEA